MNTPGRILCVEDDQNICELLGIMFRRAGYEVKSARTLEEGINLARRESFDLYILDQMFSDGTGLELCRRLREFDSQTSIIFFSGLASEMDRGRAMEAGAQGYLIKPDDLGIIVVTVKRLTAKKEKVKSKKVKVRLKPFVIKSGFLFTFAFYLLPFYLFFRDAVAAEDYCHVVFAASL
jgi:DNA-binding response OmpR family regulator